MIRFPSESRVIPGGGLSASVSYILAACLLLGPRLLCAQVRSHPTRTLFFAPARPHICLALSCFSFPTQLLLRWTAAALYSVLCFGNVSAVDLRSPSLSIAASTHNGIPCALVAARLRARQKYAEHSLSLYIYIYMRSGASLCSQVT